MKMLHMEQTRLHNTNHERNEECSQSGQSAQGLFPLCWEIPRHFFGTSVFSHLQKWLEEYLNIKSQFENRYNHTYIQTHARTCAEAHD